MPEPYADTLATVAAGRTALVARLRTIAARVEALPLESAAELLVFLEPAVAVLEREAALALERAPTEAGERWKPGPVSLVHTTSAHRRVTAVCAFLPRHPKDLSSRSLTAMTALARKW